MAKDAKNAKCTCNWGWVIIALILFTIGFWGVVEGFRMHFSGGAEMTNVLVMYFVGFLVLMLGKMAKWKAHGNCQAHSK